MQRIIFYSWQSDLPNATNRSFIETALERAASAIAKDNTVAIEPVIDRDTQGISGSPDIASTILSKIAAADAVVADISFIQRPVEGRPCPNPNVLIELGYALRAIAYERVILVFNLAYGKVEELPFDLRMRRVLTYNMPEQTKDRAIERNSLERKFEVAIRAALQHAPLLEEAAPPVIGSIESGAPNRLILLRRELARIFKAIMDAQPKTTRDGGTVADLIVAIEQTEQIAVDFSRIAETVALMNDQEAALELYNWFSGLFERYNTPAEFSGTYYESDFDYFRFVGHELFVTLFAFLLREAKWQILARLFGEPIALKYVRREGRAANVSWTHASSHVLLLQQEGLQKGRASLRADVLNARHTTGKLASLLPAEDFMAADCFLFLKAILQPDQTLPQIPWWPWSCLYLKHSPRFILKAEVAAWAEEIVRVFGLPSIPVFKQRFIERAPRLHEVFSTAVAWDFPVPQSDIDRVGTR